LRSRVVSSAAEPSGILDRGLRADRAVAGKRPF
jgi:hypothetical protein